MGPYYTRAELVELAVAAVPITLLLAFYITLALDPDVVLATVACGVLGMVVGMVMSRVHVARLRVLGRLGPKVNMREERRRHEARMAELDALLRMYRR